jgi:hypothetical protein
MLRGLCHRDVAHLRVAGGGNGLQIWSVATNILNKQLRTADKEWSFSVEVGRGLTTHNRKHCYECFRGPWNWTDSLQ